MSCAHCVLSLIMESSLFHYSLKLSSHEKYFIDYQIKDLVRRKKGERFININIDLPKHIYEKKKSKKLQSEADVHNCICIVFHCKSQKITNHSYMPHYQNIMS